MNEKKVVEILEKYPQRYISLFVDDQLRVEKEVKMGDLDFLKQNKAEVVQYLKKKKEQEEEEKNQKEAREKEEEERQTKMKLYFGCDTEKIYTSTQFEKFPNVEKRYSWDVQKNLKNTKTFYFFWATNDKTEQHIPSDMSNDGNVIVDEKELEKLKAEFEKRKTEEGWRNNWGVEYVEVEKSELREWERALELDVEEKYKKTIEMAKERAKEKEEENQKALEEAKRTGKNVEIRRIGSYDGDSDREARKKFGEECGIILVSEIATPDGKIEQVESACY